MGKGQRNRVASTTYVAKKDGNGGKLKTALIIIAVVAVLLVLVALTVFNLSKDQGWFEGNDVVMNTENFSVTDGMFAYFFRETFMNTYNMYASFLGDNVSSYIDASKSLKEQSYGDGTWYDYILGQTKDAVTEYLSLCERAREKGISLESEDYDSINTAINSLKESSKTAKYPSVGDYIRAVFGVGVNESKIRRALEIEQLAQKYARKVVADVDVSDEVLEAKYAEDPIKYDEVDYLTYTFKYEDLLPKKEEAESGDEEKADATEEEIAAAKETVTAASEELAKITEEDAFKDYVKKYETEKKGSTDETAESAANSVLKTGAKYSESDEAMKWAFEAKAGESKIITSEDGATVKVCVLVTERFRNDNNGDRHVRHVLFGTDEYGDDAEAEAKRVYDEWVAAGATEEGITELAGQYSTDKGSKDKGGLYDDVTEGKFVEPFNTWLFDENRKEGDHDLLETEYGWHIVYFIEKHDPQWKETIKSDLTSKAYEDESASAKEAYPVTVAENIEVDA